MLRKLRLHNFRTYINAELEFQRRHLLIGRNNSGKSNLCQALSFLAGTASGSLLDAANAWVYGGIRELTNWQFKSKSVEVSLECELSYKGSDLQFVYDLDLTVGPAGGMPVAGAVELQVAKEHLIVSGGATGKETLIENNGQRGRVLEDPPHRRHLPGRIQPGLHQGSPTAIGL